ncbi:MAG: DUF362 domain-containing protein [Anaerolineales bacterium]|nr:MAG: DUF362 domain-containing protein [Anaerolineales bacterium]
MISRREFLRRSMFYTLTLAGGHVLAGCSPSPTTTQPPTATSASTAGTALTATPAATTPPTAASTSSSAPTPTNPPATVAATQPADTAGTYLAVVRGQAPGPAELTRRAIAAVGGIERYVKQGADVIVKPNICNAYHGPEYASTTNPEVVAAIVALCLGAGAGRVRVMDYPFGGTAQNAYQTSGIAQAVEAAGGQMELMNSLKYQTVEIPNAQALNKTEIYADILNADVIINVPIAKHHSMATLTLGLKNLMGVVLDRGALHASGLPQSIVDLATIVRPQLTVIDATRILVANGPTGGNLDDVKQVDTIIASADVVAADAYAATLFGKTGADIAYITMANERSLGTMDLGSIRIEEISA